MKADPDRVLRDLYHLRKIGTYKSGVHRPTLSQDDITARKWLAGQLTDIGHETCIDGVANVFGRAPGAGPHVLCGSHLESQNHAGWLDGALGVVYALEAARVAASDNQLVGRGVDVIAFADEEGHFSGDFSFLGSESFVGEISEEQIDAATDRSGRGTLREMLAKQELDGRQRVSMEAGRYCGFLEAHIEQGDRLESAGRGIGVVTSIVAIWQYRITATGFQNHAGTTTMKSRRDAGRALMQVWSAIEASFPTVCGPDSVWTVGRVTLQPGQPSIIPGQAEMVFQFRDADPDNLNRMHDALTRLTREVDAASPCALELEVLAQSSPAHMAKGPKDALQDAAQQWAPDHYSIMPSGAGHDAQVIARHIPSGMMFVPSIGGISHHWSENTSDSDIALGAQVYVQAVLNLLAANSNG